MSQWGDSDSEKRKPVFEHLKMSGHPKNRRKKTNGGVWAGWMSEWLTERWSHSLWQQAVGRTLWVGCTKAWLCWNRGFTAAAPLLFFLLLEQGASCSSKRIWTRPICGVLLKWETLFSWLEAQASLPSLHPYVSSLSVLELHKTTKRDYTHTDTQIQRFCSAVDLVQRYESKTVIMPQSI